MSVLSWLSTLVAVLLEIAILSARPMDDGKNNEPSLTSKRMCRLPSESGICTETITRWYYSPHTKQCVEFMYGGCNGNENNFDNKTVCEDSCDGVNPCPYVAWVPGCTLKANGENPDGCQIYDIACEPARPENPESTDTVRTVGSEQTVENTHMVPDTDTVSPTDTGATV